MHHQRAGAARARHGPVLSIGADVIAGFPGETEAEFEEGLAFVDSLDLAYLHVFRYSPRPGTPAIGDQNPVPQQVARERTRRLREISEAKRAAFADTMPGRSLAVFVEGPAERPDEMRGLTENYLRALIRGRNLQAGEWARMRVDGADEGIVAGVQSGDCV